MHCWETTTVTTTKGIYTHTRITHAIMLPNSASSSFMSSSSRLGLALTGNFDGSLARQEARGSQGGGARHRARSGTPSPSRATTPRRPSSSATTAARRSAAAQRASARTSSISASASPRGVPGGVPRAQGEYDQGLSRSEATTDGGARGRGRVRGQGERQGRRLVWGSYRVQSVRVCNG